MTQMCLICRSNHDKEQRIEDIYAEKHRKLKETLEIIVKRRLFPAKFDATEICNPCFSLVSEYQKLQRSLIEIEEKLRYLFDLTNPIKRGRKKIVITENTIKTEPEEAANDVRKSKRARKIKDVFSEDAKFQESTRKIKNRDIVSSMAIKCPHCDFAADSEASIERHMRKDHCEDGKAFACEHCGKSFAHKDNLTIHQKTHDLEKPFECDKCDKTYKQRNSLREHVLSSHDNILKHGCQLCEEKFPSRHLLKAHERCHSGQKGFICDECGEVLSSKQSLESHKSKHSGQYAFPCTICDRGFNCKTMLYEHSLTHTGEKPLECEKCGKRFSNRGTFWVHKKLHDDPKPYKCPFCEKAFSHSSHLSVHKRIHTGEKPYKCRFCPWSSISATHLKSHMRNHTNKLPFGCGQCNLGFKLKIDLVKHCEVEHNGVLLMQDGNSQNDMHETTVIQYIYEENDEDPLQEPTEKYTVVNIGDVAAHVIDGTNSKIVSSTQNEDGTTTLMVENTTGEQIDSKNIVILRIQDDADENLSQ